MKWSLIAFVLFFAFGCAGTRNATMRSNELNGTWVPIRQELGRTVLPKAAFEKQVLVISDSNYTFTAESIDKGVIRYGDNKMDIFGKEGVNAGRHFTAIYKYENEQLTICYNVRGDSYPETFETKDKPTYFLSVFKKEIKE